MVIGIDGNEANVTNQVGVSVYSSNLLKRFAGRANNDVQFCVYLRREPVKGMPKPNKWFSYEIVQGPALWTKVFLPLRLYTKRTIDVFFTPAHYAPSYCPVPLVVTIHDLAYFYFPHEFLRKDLYKLTEWTKSSLARASSVVAVSKTTKKDIIKFYGTPGEKITVIYNGFEKAVQAATKTTFEALEKTYSISKQQYILYVGTLQPRKNIETLIEGFAQVNDKNIQKLVIVGKKGWMYDDILMKAQKLNITDRVIFTGYLSDDEVMTLYSNALCFVMPSLYEGFGIPILEAMSQDCPVLSSFASSLPEVGGDACLYFDPRDAHQLAEKITMVAHDPKMRKELVHAGREVIKSYSWDRCADETLAVLKHAAAYET